MWNATIGAEELANISSYVRGQKLEKLSSNHEARFISWHIILLFYATEGYIFLFLFWKDLKCFVVRRRRRRRRRRRHPCRRLSVPIEFLRK